MPVKTRGMKRRGIRKARPASAAKKARSNQMALTKVRNPANLVKIAAYGFPDTMRMRIAYGDKQTLTSSAINLTPTYNYRLNSIYDPDYTGIGAQPYWRDQLAAIYNRYRVLGAKISVTFANSPVTDTTTTQGPFLVGIQNSNTNALNNASSAGLLCSPNTVCKTLSKETGPVTCSMTYSPAQVFGKAGQWSDDLAAGIGNNPARGYLATLFASNDGSNAVLSVVAHVVIEYYVELSDQILNVGS